jgi:transglutaminase-like putative cysteine protease
MLHSGRVTLGLGWAGVQTRFNSLRVSPAALAAGIRIARGCGLASLLLVSALVAAAPQMESGNEAVAPPAEVVALVEAGRFREAEARIAAGLARPALGDDERRALLFERERTRRILLDFDLDAAQAKAKLRKQIPDLADAEFAKWDDAGLLESMVIDGRKRYFDRAPSNLFRLSTEARARRAVQAPFVDSPYEKPHAHHREVREQALATGKRSVAPRRVRITQSLTVHAGAVPAGETVRAWIPFPRAIPGQQEDIRVLGSEPAQRMVAPESALQRTVYLEKPARAGVPTAFSVSYELTIHGQYVAIDPDKVVPAEITSELAPFVAERPPHIVFTNAMRQFSTQAVGDEKNPYRIAQKLFAAVDRIPWAGAREYSTITNISDYALHAGHADCGQQTLLLMTLLRMNGIPARWQSGWIFSDGDYDNMHDWGWLYLAPYGWVPMDVTFGRLPGAGAEIADFYLGGFDAYRIAFNDDYSRDFVPPKQHFRSETVDLQRGEVEWDGGNLYFDQWDYDFEWQLSPLVTDERD